MRVAIVIRMTLNRNSGGFTLVEVIMAVLILLVGMLGLLQAVNLAMEVNLRNQVREEAVYVGERVMTELRGDQGACGSSYLELQRGYLPEPGGCANFNPEVSRCPDLWQKI